MSSTLTTDLFDRSDGATIDAAGLDEQLKKQRRAVDFDTFDMHTSQLISMVERKAIHISPTYQRQFRWDPKRCSQLIESLMLGIPIPSLFMATNADSTWDVVDGVQRLSTVISFAGSAELRQRLSLQGPLVLSDLQKLDRFNGLTFDQLPPSIKLHFETRGLKVVTLNDKSDRVVRYDLFERLNTGGVRLTPQEIRDCVFEGEFANTLDTLSEDPNFKRVVRLTDTQEKDGTAEECVLRFFAFADRYEQFQHGVDEFLTQYMNAASKSFDLVGRPAEFRRVFEELAKVFPEGLRRRSTGRKTTSLILFEGIAVGAALALRKVSRLSTKRLNVWMASNELRKVTTGATNDRAAVKGRIEFCRDRFMGKPYVPATAD
jgi:hypothetical protein